MFARVRVERVRDSLCRGDDCPRIGQAIFRRRALAVRSVRSGRLQRLALAALHVAAHSGGPPHSLGASDDLTGEVG